MAKKKKSTQVALGPALGKALLYGGTAGAGVGVSRLMNKIFGDDTNTKEAKTLQKMIVEETEKAKDKKGIKTDYYKNKSRIQKVKKGGLIKVRRGDGIAKRGKTKGRMI